MDVNDNTHLSSALSNLKEQGSSLLVAGAVPDDRHAALSKQLLGDPTDGPRSNVLVLTEDRIGDVADRLPAGASLSGPGSPQIIRVKKSDRSAAAQSGATPSVAPVAEVDAEALDELATTIFDTISGLDAEQESREPSQLRFAFDSLTPLLHLHGEEAVFKVLALLNHSLRERQAMAHFHLPVGPDTKPAKLLRPLFDVFVELRWTNNHVQQRWHVRDANMTTDWLDL
jgi:hypothetical protein